MTDFLDHTVTAFILPIAFAVLGGILGLAFTGSFGIVSTGIALLLYGFIAGQVGRQHDRIPLGFLAVSGAGAAVFAELLPVSLVQGLAGFVIGYAVGLRMDRR